MGSRQPLTRTRKTLRRMGPLTRQIQEVQNDLVKLAKKLDRLQEVAGQAEGMLLMEQAEAKRRRGEVSPEVEYVLAKENVRLAKEMPWNR